jgi:hypothetical protein
MNRMRRPVWLALIASAALASCASEPEMKMTPAASGGGVGVRYAQGEAFMLSGGSRGAIMLLPVRYNLHSGKTLFAVAGYNNSSDPLNFGPENISIRLDNGADMPIHDFDNLRHNAIEDADRQRLLATVQEAVETSIAYHVSRRHPREGREMMRDTAQDYDDRLHSIAQNLSERVERAKAVLQTTTIDPNSYWSGWVLADQPALAQGEVRQMAVSVEFAGETHHFNLFLSPEGTATPRQVSLPAVPKGPAMKALYGTDQTWLWNVPLPPTHVDEPKTWTVGRF